MYFTSFPSSLIRRTQTSFHSTSNCFFFQYISRHFRMEYYSILLLIILLISSFDLDLAARPPPRQVPCYFIFGDSLVDNGNNNVFGRNTRARVNYSPYGIDFPAGPTGRFSNGLTQADVLAQLLGFHKRIPPFVSARGHEILQGVNYASGSAGIRNDSGKDLGARTSLNKQLRHHHTTIRRLTTILGAKKAAALLKKCLYTVGMGSNDYINNYFLPNSTVAKQFSPDRYATILINQYSAQIKALHAAGARKVALFGVGLIGCTPNAISTFGTNNASCVDYINNAAFLFNDKLKSLVNRLNYELPDSNFTYINIVGISLGDPIQSGFTVSNRPCCEVDDVGQCKENSTVGLCPDRNLYVFFDGFHPTEKLNILTTARVYKALLPSDASPFDISQLVQQ